MLLVVGLLLTLLVGGTFGATPNENDGFEGEFVVDWIDDVFCVNVFGAIFSFCPSPVSLVD